MARIWQEPKDPDEEFDYAVDWTSWLAQWNDTIQSSAWTVPAPLVNESSSHTSTTATIYLSGGVNGTDYRLLNSIVTVGGRENELTCILKVRTK